jgi:1,4-dihydroxy-2-naphthoyl-CoA hydrolase
MLNTSITLEQLNAIGANSMVAHLGIEFTDLGSDFIRAKMPVDERTKQPLGLLHGGASLALAETLGSVASELSIDMSQVYPVGLAMSANYLRPVKSGYVYGTVRPIHVGRRTHVWEIKIFDEAENLVSISRLTMMIVSRESIS